MFVYHLHEDALGSWNYDHLRWPGIDNSLLRKFGFAHERQPEVGDLVVFTKGGRQHIIDILELQASVDWHHGAPFHRGLAYSREYHISTEDLASIEAAFQVPVTAPRAPAAYLMSPGQFETSQRDLPPGRRTFGFPCMTILRRPTAGDLVVIDRLHGRVCYLIDEVGTTKDWDPEIPYWEGKMTDVNEHGLWTHGRWDAFQQAPKTAARGIMAMT